MKPVRYFSFGLIALSLFNLSSAFAGVGAGGGGTTIGGHLAEDVLPKIDMEGTERIPSTDLERLVDPLMKQLESKLPHLAAKLRLGLTEIPWYTDTKRFSLEMCQDQSMFDVHQVIRACQDDKSIRISKSFFDSGSKLLPDLVMHELVVHAAQTFPVDRKTMQVSAAVRNPSISADDLQKIVIDNGMGYYLTAPELQSAREGARGDICAVRSDSFTSSQMDKLFEQLETDQSFFVDDYADEDPNVSSLSLFTNKIADLLLASDVDGLRTQLKSIQSDFGCSSQSK